MSYRFRPRTERCELYDAPPGARRRPAASGSIRHRRTVPVPSSIRPAIRPGDEAVAPPASTRLQAAPPQHRHLFALAAGLPFRSARERSTCAGNHLRWTRASMVRTIAARSRAISATHLGAWLRSCSISCARHERSLSSSSRFSSVAASAFLRIEVTRESMVRSSRRSSKDMPAAISGVKCE